MAGALPSGTVTFLLTDIEGSTALFKRLAERYQPLLEAHCAIIRDAVERQGGVVVKTEGDSFLAAFASAASAVAAAVAAQLDLGRHPWPDDGVIKVRMGLHTGEATPSDGDYVALCLHQAARISTAGHGGQVLLSPATTQALGGGLPENASLVDLGRYRIRDFDDAVTLHRVAHPELSRDHPALRALPAAGHNLPLYRDDFVGRGHDLAEVVELVRANRLATIAGPGGVGKTRLAVEAAARLIADYPDGVWLVALAPVTDPDLLAHAVAATVGAVEQQGVPLATTVCEHLAVRNALIVLDNCEHLVEAAARMVEMLVGTTTSDVLVTTREPLRVPGEAAWRIPTLNLPDVGEGVESMLRHDAVELFCRRAAAAKPGFALDAENAAAVADICRRLDGIPLAIELAAARVRILSPAQIAERLSDRFTLLGSGSRTALPHQRTLWALLDWSYQLLSEPERLLFMRLAVFGGSFSLESIEAVCTDDDLDLLEVVDLLDALVEKSLVVALHTDPPRFVLLETLRSYALTKLEEADDGDDRRQRLLAYLTAEATRLRSEGPLENVYLRWCDAEHDNVRTALRWAIETGRGDGAMGLLDRTFSFFWVRGHFDEGRGWFVEAMDLEVTDVWKCRALYCGALLSSDRDEWERWFVENVALAETTGDARTLAAALHGFADVLWFKRDDLDGAVETYGRARALYLEIDTWSGVATIDRTLGQIHRATGERERGLAEMLDALGRLRAGGFDWEILRTLTMLGSTLASEDPEAALGYLREALAIAREVGDPALECDSAATIADLEMRMGHRAAADAVIAEVVAVAAAHHQPLWSIEARLVGARGALDHGDIAQATAAVAQAREEFAGRRQYRAGLGWLANLMIDLDDRNSALALVPEMDSESGVDTLVVQAVLCDDDEVALALLERARARRGEDGAIQAQADVVAARILLRTGALSAASERAEAALGVLRQAQARARTADTLDVLAELAMAAGDRAAALAHLEAAAAIRQEFGLVVVPGRRSWYEELRGRLGL